MGVNNVRKITLGIIELSAARVHIDLLACYFAVGSPYPGGAAAAKGGDRELGLKRRETVLLLFDGGVGT